MKTSLIGGGNQLSIQHSLFGLQKRRKIYNEETNVRFVNVCYGYRFLRTCICGRYCYHRANRAGCFQKYANMIYDKDWREEYRNYNVMLERRLKANYRTGFWEMIFLHTKPLAAVPSDMRAGRNQRAQRHFGFDKIACPKGLAIGCRTGYTNTKNAEKMY